MFHHALDSNPSPHCPVESRKYNAQCNGCSLKNYFLQHSSAQHTVILCSDRVGNSKNVLQPIRVWLNRPMRYSRKVQFFCERLRCLYSGFKRLCSRDKNSYCRSHGRGIRFSYRALAADKVRWIIDSTPPIRHILGLEQYSGIGELSTAVARDVLLAFEWEMLGASVRASFRFLVRLCYPISRPLSFPC